MTEIEARAVAEAYYKELVKNGKLPNEVLKSWGTWQPTAVQWEGFWFIDYCGAGDYFRTQGIVVRPDGNCRLVFGAAGNAWMQMRQAAGLSSPSRGPNPGLPTTNERYLGSTTWGRYQTFEHMDVVWEGGNAIDVGFVRLGSDRSERPCSIAAVVIDIRGFTTFSEVRPASEVQSVLNDLEQVVQEKFAARWKDQLFVKGTGDGALIVSEDGWANGQLVPSVCEASTAILQECRTLPWYKTPDGLTVGIGIDHGPAKRISLWGRPDYIASCINHASKIQACAADAVAISRAVMGTLDLTLPLRTDARSPIEYALLEEAA